MRFSKKTIALALCIVMCMSMTALGTVAYLTSRDSVANTFTIGNIRISVDETKVSENGDPLVLVKHENGETTEELLSEMLDAGLNDDDFQYQYVKSNKYKLIPGKSYFKDPKLTLLADSESAYVRMIVTINCYEGLTAALKTTNPVEVFEALIPETHDDWTYHNSAAGEDNTYTYEFRYSPEHGDVVYPEYYEDGTSGNAELPPLFETIQIPHLFSSDIITRFGLDTLTISVEGHAIQSDTFDEGGAEAAWQAFDAQTAYDASFENNEENNENN